MDSTVEPGLDLLVALPLRLLALSAVFFAYSAARVLELERDFSEPPLMALLRRALLEPWTAASRRTLFVPKWAA